MRRNAPSDLPIVALHTIVPGRARFHIAGLYHDAALKGWLELELADRDGIVSATANPRTGNILVLFERTISLDRVQQWLEKAFRAYEHAQKPAQVRGEGSQLLNRRQAPFWYRRTADDLVILLRSSAKRGLSNHRAARRLLRFGPNRLPVPAGRSSVDILLEQFNSLPVALLGVSAVLSLLTGGVLEAAVIVGVIALNAGIGFVTESEAERTIRDLSAHTAGTATVIRSGRRLEVPIEEVVPGDLLDLRPGGLVAADARLLSADRLTIDESALTGESMPAAKTVMPLADAGAPIAERTNFVFMGTTVASGQGRVLVVATGKKTELGLINRLIGESQPPATPLQRQLEELGNRLVLASCMICSVVFALGLVRGYGILSMLKSSISLAIAAVPEGLPAVATTTLALGIRAMRRHKVLIRELHAVESLGAVQVMCFDKTGTITFNRMTAVAISAGGHERRLDSNRDSRLEQPEFRRLMETAVLCNEAVAERVDRDYRIDGSPTEAALIRLALDHGLDVVALRQRFPLSRIEYRAEGRQYMATTHRLRKGEWLLAVKGNPSAVLGLCSHRMADGRSQPLSNDDIAALGVENDHMAAAGLRVLGFAYAVRKRRDGVVDKDLCWLGLVGMSDPVRPGMTDLIDTFHTAGIRTVMITGDQSATTVAVAKQLNLRSEAPPSIVDASRLAHKSPSELAAIAHKVDAFARVSPRHKLEIVRAFQSAGQVTAMTGDGINDGPALKAADVGIALGRQGTDLARQVASVVLENDELATMLEAIVHGRTIHANIKRSIDFVIATNLSEIMVMLGGIGLGIGQPLQPLQLLWINLISDVLPCLALAVAPPEADVMQHPPRDPAAPIIGGADLPRLLREAAVLSAGALASYGYGLWRYGVGPRTSTLAFASLISAQLLHAWTCGGDWLGGRPRNRYLDGAVAGSIGLQIAANFLPGLRRLLGLEPLGLTDASIVTAGALGSFTINQAARFHLASVSGSNRGQERQNRATEVECRASGG